MQGNEIKQSNHSAVFSYDSYLRGNCSIYRLQGRLVEQKQADSLLLDIRSELNASGKSFIIDMAGIEYLNSTGIGDMIRLIRLVNKEKGKLVFVKVPQKISDLLEIIRLNCLLTICNNEEEAIQSLLN